MNRIAGLAALAGLLLAGCSDPGDTRSDRARNEAARRLAKDQAAPAGPEAAMIGRWATDRTCSDAIVYVEDGSLGTTSDRVAGYRAGRWSLAGDRMTWAGVDGASTFRVTDIDADSHTAVRSDGTRRHYIRC